MNIAVGSAFRNSQGRIGQYMERVARLRDHAGAGNTVEVIAVEGDSTDRTREQLVREAQNHRLALHLFTCNHGQKVFGSTEEPARMVALSKVGNAIFDGVQPHHHALLYVESDLLWEPHQVGSIIDLAMAMDNDADVVAPMIYAGKAFYDTWGFRGLDSSRFAPFAPYHSSIKGKDNQLVEVSSVGSCLAMRADVARRVRIVNDYCLVGWCQNARSHGYRVAVHTGFKVNHP